MSSSIIWLNGEEFYRAGKVGESDDDTVTGVRNELLAAASPEGTLELVVQAANYRMNGTVVRQIRLKVRYMRSCLRKK